MALSLIQAESMNLSDTYNFVGTVTGAGDALPKGTIIPYAGVALPSGWLLCDGSQKTITGTYQSLYNALTNSGTVFPYGGNTNGSGAVGTTHFRLPDLNGRLIVGKAASATRLVGTGNTRTVTAKVNGAVTDSANIGLNTNVGTIEIGMYVSGTNIPADAFVKHVTDQNNIILSEAVSGTLADTTDLTFGIIDDLLGSTGGGMNHTLTGAESGTSAHSHGASSSYVVVSALMGSNTVGLQTQNANHNSNSTSYINVTVDNSTAASASEAHTNIQPSIVLNYLINY